MRAHGVPNFPDPGPKGGMTVLFSPGSATPTIQGITFGGPAFQAAERICKPLGNPGAGPPAITEQQKRAMVDFANCMRHHGLPQWADPTFPPGGGVFGGGGPYNKNTPRLMQATNACTRAAGRQEAG
jgi:hypothetical protein